jgi:hypothetical protein
LSSPVTPPAVRVTAIRHVFQLDDQIKRFGIIAVPNPDYDAPHWWRYSEGVEDVVKEGVAYLYARLFFFPPKPVHAEKLPQISQGASFGAASTTDGTIFWQTRCLKIITGILPRSMSGSLPSMGTL